MTPSSVTAPAAACWHRIQSSGGQTEAPLHSLHFWAVFRRFSLLSPLLAVRSCRTLRSPDLSSPSRALPCSFLRPSVPSPALSCHRTVCFSSFLAAESEQASTTYLPSLPVKSAPVLCPPFRALPPHRPTIHRSPSTAPPSTVHRSTINHPSSTVPPSTAPPSTVHHPNVHNPAHRRVIGPACRRGPLPSGRTTVRLLPSPHNVTVPSRGPAVPLLERADRAAMDWRSCSERGREKRSGEGWAVTVTGDSS